MPTVTVRQSITKDGISRSQDVELTGGSWQEIDETIAGESTDVEVDFVLDVSQCKAFWIESDQDCTVETNSSTVPDDTLTLEADKPYLWHEDSGGTFALGTDVTALFVTVAGATDAALKIRVLKDPTV